MSKSTSDAAVLDLALDRAGREPLHAQLAEALRRFILARRIAPGARLPASRVLAQELGISRVTVVAAFDQLIGEGYAEGRRGSGVYVAADLPEQALELHRPMRPEGDLPTSPATSPPRPFQPAAPDLSLFPYAEWAKLLDRQWRRPSSALVNHADPMGWPPLRAMIADYLGAARGIACSPGQIAITSGLAESIDLIVRAFLPPCARVLVEDPGYPLLRRAFASVGHRVDALPVDQSGFNPADETAAAAALTPSRQYPLGTTMPLPRRLQLLEWARALNAILIEDDYDSEYRYRGRPLPALMSLDQQGCVVYLGSFSKVLSSSLRLGYAVVAEERAARIRTALAEAGPKASLVPQPALAEFMASGQFAAHVRRMRRVYAKRQEALLAAAEAHLAPHLELTSEAAGMHLLARLAPRLRMDDIEASERALAAGVFAPALSRYYVGVPRQRGLLLGYAGFGEAVIESAARKLAASLS
jgi:GntR family transcriptional regulator/MocR family aminotransferase